MSNSIILIGYEGGNLLGQLRTFGVLGYRPHVIIVENGAKPYFIAKSKYIGSYSVVQSFEEGLALIVKEHGDESIKPFIFTDSDYMISLLDKEYDKLKDHFLFFNAGENGHLSPYLEKENLCALAQKCGLRVPRTELVRKGELPQTIPYPIITKSEDSFLPGWKHNVFICNDEKELLDAYDKIEDDTIILQEYIVKKNEYILQGLSINNGNTVFIPIEGSFYRVHPSSYSHYLYFKDFRGETVELNAMFKELKFNGIFEVEFLVTQEDELVFLEINFRQTAWNHTFTRMGYCLEKIWMDSTLKGCLVTDEGTRRYNLLSEFGDYNQFVRSGKVSLRQWLKDIKSADNFQYYNKYDKGPFYSYIRRMLFSAIKHKLGIKEKKH